MPDIDKMSDSEIVDYLKQRNKKKATNVVAEFIEDKLTQSGIEIKCPKCGSAKRIEYGTTTSGVNKYKCKDCGKFYNALTNTIFEATDYTWDEMVDIVHDVITYQSINYVASTTRNTKIDKRSAWAIYHKVLHLLAQFEKPVLQDVIQIDEKYIRESQKGSRDMVSLLSDKDVRRRRKHCYRSECGIFGPEFANILCAIDNHGHYYAKVVCLGTLSMNELADLQNHISKVSYLCSDNLELYSLWCEQNGWKHYVEPSTYRKERKARGYIDTDDIYKTLTDEDYAADRKINERLYKEGRYPHIENYDRKLSYDEFVALKYKFNLNINTVNSFHADLEYILVNSKTGVSINYLTDYVDTICFLRNYKSQHRITFFSKKDAENILLEICKMTLEKHNVPTRQEIEDMNIDNLPRPSTKIINQARKRMKDLRVVVDFKHPDPKDKSAYEGDETSQYIFNRRKFLNSIGVIRLNELAKIHGVYKTGMNKRQKIDALSALPNIDDIIFYEIYLHRYGTDSEFANSINQLPQPKKRGRKEKTKP